MPRLRTYTQTVDTPDPSRAPLPHANPIRVLDPGLDGFARGVQSAAGLVAQEVNRSQEEEARAWSAGVLSEARLQWTQELINRQTGAEPGAPEFTPKFVKDYDDYANKAIEKATSPKARAFLTNRLAELRNDLGIKAMEFEAKARVDYRTDQFTRAIDNTTKLMNTDPTQFEVALAEQLAIIDSAAIPPIQKSALREKAVAKISESAVWSQVQRSPTEFLGSIGFDVTGRRKSDGDLKGITGNKAFDALAFERRVTMFDQAIRLKAQIDADADRAVKKLAEEAANNASKELWALNADGKLTRNHIENRRVVLPVDEYKSLLKALSDPDKTQKSDPATYRELQRLMYEDPDAAAKFAFQQHAAGRLSNEHLSSSVNHARTLARQEGPKSEYERSRQFITQSLDPGPLVQDPLGRSRLAEAIDMFDRWFMAEKRPDKEVADRAREITNQFRMINLNDTLLGLPQPRSGALPRDASDPGQIINGIAERGIEAKRRFDAREWSKRDLDEEMAILNQWRKAVTGSKR